MTAGKDAIGRFFTYYLPRFKYNPQNPFWSEFHRLHKAYEWDKMRRPVGDDVKGQNSRPDGGGSRNQNDEDKKRPKMEECPEAKKAWGNFRRAMVEDFGEVFGRKVDDPEAWGRLCETAGIKPIPKDLKGRHDVSIPCAYIIIYEYIRGGWKS